ncbi:MAG: 30S ribosomal protein S6 [Planctomycetota bacterium]
MAEQKAEVTAAMEAPVHKRLYEAVFLISQGVAADFNGVIDHINQIFERASAEVVAMKKWDERRLAYEIDKQKRGIYILAYLSAEPDAVAKIESDCNISEQIMRFMVIRADHMTLEEAQNEDDRQGLEAEAKLRAEKGEESEQKSSGVRLGAPEPEKKPEAEASDDSSDGDSAPEGDSGDASGDASGDTAGDDEN